jgi:DnaJ-domain-containing protein 1
MEIWQDPPDDPETVRRAAAILEAYVSKASLMALRDERRDLRDEEEPEAERMSRGEALEVLGLEPGADEDEIRAAHKRLLRLVHPDRGGSAYLTRRVYEARDALLEPQRKTRTRTRTGDDE